MKKKIICILLLLFFFSAVSMGFDAVASKDGINVELDDMNSIMDIN